MSRKQIEVSNSILGACIHFEMPYGYLSAGLTGKDLTRVQQQANESFEQLLERRHQQQNAEKEDLRRDVQAIQGRTTIIHQIQHGVVAFTKQMSAGLEAEDEKAGRSRATAQPGALDAFAASDKPKLFGAHADST